MSSEENFENNGDSTEEEMDNNIEQTYEDTTQKRKRGRPKKLNPTPKSKTNPKLKYVEVQNGNNNQNYIPSSKSNHLSQQGQNMTVYPYPNMPNNQHLKYPPQQQYAPPYYPPNTQYAPTNKQIPPYLKNNVKLPPIKTSQPIYTQPNQYPNYPPQKNAPNNYAPNQYPPNTYHSNPNQHYPPQYPNQHYQPYPSNSHHPPPNTSYPQYQTNYPPQNQYPNTYPSHYSNPPPNTTPSHHPSTTVTPIPPQQYPPTTVTPQQPQYPNTTPTNHPSTTVTPIPPQQYPPTTVAPKQTQYPPQTQYLHNNNSPTTVTPIPQQPYTPTTVTPVPQSSQYPSTTVTPVPQQYPPDESPPRYTPKPSQQIPPKTTVDVAPQQPQYTHNNDSPPLYTPFGQYKSPSLHIEKNAPIRRTSSQSLSVTPKPNVDLTDTPKSYYHQQKISSAKNNVHVVQNTKRGGFIRSPFSEYPHDSLKDLPKQNNHYKEMEENEQLLKQFIQTQTKMKKTRTPVVTVITDIPVREGEKNANQEIQPREVRVNVVPYSQPDPPQQPSKRVYTSHKEHTSPVEQHPPLSVQLKTVQPMEIHHDFETPQNPNYTKVEVKSVQIDIPPTPPNQQPPTETEIVINPLTEKQHERSLHVEQSELPKDQGNITKFDRPTEVDNSESVYEVYVPIEKISSPTKKDPSPTKKVSSPTPQKDTEESVHTSIIDSPKETKGGQSPQHDLPTHSPTYSPNYSPHYSPENYVDYGMPDDDDKEEVAIVSMDTNPEDSNTKKRKLSDFSVDKGTTEDGPSKNKPFENDDEGEISTRLTSKELFRPNPHKIFDSILQKRSPPPSPTITKPPPPFEPTDQIYLEEEEPWRKISEVILSKTSPVKNVLDLHVYTQGKKKFPKDEPNDYPLSIVKFNLSFPLSYSSLDTLSKNLGSQGICPTTLEIPQDKFSFSEQIEQMITSKIFDKTIQDLSLGYKNELKIEKDRILLIKYKDGNNGYNINLCNLNNTKLTEYEDESNLVYRNTVTVAVFFPVDKFQSFHVKIAYNNITERKFGMDLDETSISYISFFDPAQVIVVPKNLQNGHNYFVCALYRVSFCGKLFPRPSERFNSILEIPPLLRCWKRLIFDYKMVRPNTRRTQLIVLNNGENSVEFPHQQLLQNLSIIAIREKIRLVISDIVFTQKGPATPKNKRITNSLDPSSYEMNVQEVYFEHTEQNVGYLPITKSLQQENTQKKIWQKEAFDIIEKIIEEKDLWYPNHVLVTDPTEETVIENEEKVRIMTRQHKAKILLLIPILQDYNPVFYNDKESSLNAVLHTNMLSVAYKFLNSCVINDWRFSEALIEKIGIKFMSFNNLGLMSHFFVSVCTRKELEESETEDQYQISSTHTAEILLLCCERFGTKEMFKVMKRLALFGYNIKNLKTLISIINELSQLVVQKSDSPNLLSLIYFCYDVYFLFYLSKIRDVLDQKEVLANFYFNPYIVSHILLSLSDLFIRDRHISSSVYPLFEIHTPKTIPKIDKKRGVVIFNSIIESLYCYSSLHEFVSVIAAVLSFDLKDKKLSHLAKPLFICSLERIVDEFSQRSSLIDKRDLRNKLKDCSCEFCSPILGSLLNFSL